MNPTQDTVSDNTTPTAPPDPVPQPVPAPVPTANVPPAPANNAADAPAAPPTTPNAAPASAQGTINYQPLQAMDNVWPAVLKQSVKLWLPIACALILISLWLVPAWSVDAMILVAVVYSGVVTKKAAKLKNGVWQAFAAANGWPLDTSTPLESAVPPSLQFGHSRKLAPGIRARLGADECDIWAYTCVTGYGRSQETHNFTVARVVLPKQLPHILLTSNKSYFYVHGDLQDAEHLKLEGDFNDHFKLQVEKGQEVDVLTILTPDVMQTLIDYNQAEDIEILGNTLYFIIGKDERDYKDMPVIFRSVTELGRQIKQNLRYT